METSKKKGFDFQAALGRALTIVQHLRLMVIMIAFGLLAGVTYYIFSDPVFYSRSIVNVGIFGAPVESRGVEDTTSSTYLIRNSLLSQLNSRHLMIRTAVGLGIVEEGASYETIRDDHIPKVEFAFLDNDHLQVTVYSFQPSVVRDFPEMLVNEYQKYLTEIRIKFREAAAERYKLELEEVRGKLVEGRGEMSAFEQQTKLAEIYIEQNNLTKVPKEIVAVKDRLARMKLVKKELVENNDLDVVGKLSLLADFERDPGVDIGNIVRAGGTGFGPLLKEKTTTKVVVEPGMVEGLASWEELNRKRREIEVAMLGDSKTYLPNHEVMLKHKADLEEVNKGLQVELDVALNRLDVEEPALVQRLENLEAKMPEYNEVTQRYDKYTQDYVLMEKGLDLWKKAYQDLESRLAVVNFEMEKQRVEMQFQGLVSLRDKDPVSPNKIKLLILSLALGVGGAIGLPMLLNLINTTTSTLMQIESATGLTGIGIVPLTSKSDLEDIVRSPAQGARVPNSLLENFRVIRSNICLHPNRRDRSQVVMVTSARPSEGKTTQSANIAWAFFSMGEKTLLIDCDLRRGRVHHLAKIENKPGLSDFMMGQCSLERAMRTIVPGKLDVIPRGSILPGSTEILCQEFFEKLVEQFRGQYDRIVIDTPPVLGLSESSSLQRLVDGVVLVVRAEKTRLKDVVDGVTLLRKSGAHMFGFVLNGIDLTKIGNYYNYYYYSAGYYDELDLDDEDPYGDKGGGGGGQQSPTPVGGRPLSPDQSGQPLTGDVPGGLIAQKSTHT